MLYSITGVVDPLPTSKELYGSDDALAHNLGLKGAAAKAAAAAAFPTPLNFTSLQSFESGQRGFLFSFSGVILIPQPFFPLFFSL